MPPMIEKVIVKRAPATGLPTKLKAVPMMPMNILSISPSSILSPFIAFVIQPVVAEESPLIRLALDALVNFFWLLLIAVFASFSWFSSSCTTSKRTFAILFNSTLRWSKSGSSLKQQLHLRLYPSETKLSKCCSERYGCCKHDQTIIHFRSHVPQIRENGSNRGKECFLFDSWAAPQYLLPTATNSGGLCGCWVLLPAVESTVCAALVSAQFLGVPATKKLFLGVNFLGQLHGVTWHIDFGISDHFRNLPFQPIPKISCFREQQWKN